MTDLDTGADLVNSTTADANALNSKFNAIETLINSTGVHKYQSGTIPTAALADESVTAGKLAPDAIGTIPSSGIASGAVTAAKMGPPEIVSATQTTGVSTSITSGSNASLYLHSDTWTVVSYGGNYVSWDAVNKRFNVLVDGIYKLRLSNLAMTLTTSSGAGIAESTTYFKKNSTTITGGTTIRSFTNREVLATAAAQRRYHEYEVVAALTAGDYVTFGINVALTSTSASVGFALDDGTGSAPAKIVQSIQYLGTAS